MARKPIRGIDFLDKCINHVRLIHTSWQYLQSLVVKYPQAGEKQAKIEHNFLLAKHSLMRDVSALRDRLGGDYLFIGNVSGFASSLATISGIYEESEEAVRQLMLEAHQTYVEINDVLIELERKRELVKQGETVDVGPYRVRIRRKIPWRRIGGTAVAAGALLTAAAAIYFMRFYLGYWAPGAGEGIVVTAEMTDAEQISALRGRMLDALETNDIDTLMTAFADDFTDPTGRSKTTMRIFIQGIMDAYGTSSILFDDSEADTTIQENIAIIEPVTVRAPIGEETIRIIGAKRNNKWLITAVEQL